MQNGKHLEISQFHNSTALNYGFLSQILALSLDEIINVSEEI